MCVCVFARVCVCVCCARMFVCLYVCLMHACCCALQALYAVGAIFASADAAAPFCTHIYKTIYIALEMHIHK